MKFNAAALVPILLTGGAAFLLWKFGGPMGKGAALGVAGVMLANQIPPVRAGLNAQLVQAA